MNRRSFISGLATSLALASLPSQLRAQEIPIESTNSGVYAYANRLITFTVEPFEGMFGTPVEVGDVIFTLNQFSFLMADAVAGREAWEWLIDGGAGFHDERIRKGTLKNQFVASFADEADGFTEAFIDPYPTYRKPVVAHKGNIVQVWSIWHSVEELEGFDAFVTPLIDVVGQRIDPNTPTEPEAFKATLITEADFDAAYPNGFEVHHSEDVDFEIAG